MSRVFWPDEDKEEAGGEQEDAQPGPFASIRAFSKEIFIYGRETEGAPCVRLEPSEAIDLARHILREFGAKAEMN